MNTTNDVLEEKKDKSNKLETPIETEEPEENNNSSPKIYSNKKINKNMSDNIYKGKSLGKEESKETSDFHVNKKLRNTMAGLNNSKMKYESGLIDMILKVEKDNVNHYLRGDLAEIYNNINQKNHNFKNDVFLANINYFEKRTGILDKRPIIPYNCTEDVSKKLNTFPKTNEIIEKFTEKAKFYQECEKENI